MLKFIFGILTLGASSLLVAEQIQLNPKEESTYISARSGKVDSRGSSSRGSIGKQRGVRDTSFRRSARMQNSTNFERRGARGQSSGIRTSETRSSSHFSRHGEGDHHWKGGHRGRDAWHHGDWGWFWGPSVLFYFDTTPPYDDYCEEIYLDAETGEQVYIDIGPAPSQEIMTDYIRAVRCGDAIYILDW